MILVAGGSGRLGRELVRRIHERGVPVRILSRNPDAARPQLPSGVHVVGGDVRDPATLKAVVAGVDAVVSAVTGFGPGGAGTRAVDEAGNVNLIAAAEAAGVRHFVLVSVDQSAPDHPMELMRCKHAAEERLRSSSLAWTIVRPTPFAGLWAGLVGDPLQTGSPATVFGRGDNPVNFVAEADVAALIDLTLVETRFEGETISVGGPEDTSMNQLVALVQAAIGRPGRVRHIPIPALRIGSRLLRPMKSDVAGLLEAAVCMAGSDMTFDSGPLQARCPTLALTTIRAVVEARFGPRPAVRTAIA